MARRGRRSKRRTAARKRAQRAAKKRVAARKAAGKKPSGAKSASQRKADNRAKAQAAAKKRIASGRTISQTKAANKKKMQDAARERNRKFQAEKAAAAKRRADAAAKKKADAAAKKAAADKAAAAKKAAEAKKRNDVQNQNLIAQTRFKSVPAPGAGPAGDNMSTKEFREGMLPGLRDVVPGESLQNTLKRITNQDMLAATGNMTNLGIRNNEATAFRQKDPASYGYPSQSEVDNAALGGGAGFIGRKPTGNPNVMSPDGTFNRPGPGGPEPESDYTSYKPGSFYNLSDTNMNPTNFMRSTRNLITSPARALGINNQFTNRLIPKSNEAIQDARDQRSQFNVGTKPRPTLKRRGGGGGVSRIQQQAAAQAIQPEIAPTIGAPPAEEYLPDDAGDLTRIQTQAYNTALTNNMAGIGGNFDFSPQGSQMSISQAPGLQAGQSRGRRQIRRFGRGRRRGSGDSFRRGGRRIQQFTSTQLNI